MRRIVTIFVLILCQGAFTAHAQMTASQKLYQLCKVWGYLKYHHPAKCSIKWNELLMEKVDSAAASANNSAFHAILYNMCLQTGVTTPPAFTTVILGDTPKNYHTAWFHDPALYLPVRNFLDSVQAHSIYNISACQLRLNPQTDPNYISHIDFRRDSLNNIPGFSYANLKHRMLAYFYYWNSVNYFFPQIEIADHPWDSTLIQLMPDMMAANTDSSFELTFARVVARIDDTHASFNGRYYYKYFTGADFASQTMHRAKLRIARVENKHVVTASDEPGIALGDIITKIEGLDADTFFARWKPYITASNEITKYRIMYNMLVYGPVSGVRHLELVDAANVSKQVDLHTSSTFAQYNTWFGSSIDTLPEWGATRCGYGYVHMGKLTRTNVALMYSDLQHRPAIIFDLRNYPNGTISNIKRLLFSGPTISARYLEPDLGYPGYYFTRDDLYNFGTWSNSTPYAGKIFILVNEQTQSQAEYTAQTLGTFPRATIIGSQTAGADGNVAYVELPNGIRTGWSSLGWYEADWHNPQRAGIRVDSLLSPTIAGIRAGRDELLEKAFDCTLQVEQRPSGSGYTIAQQAGEIIVSSTGIEPFRIEMINMLGQRVFSRGRSIQKTSIGTSDFTPGNYLIIVSDRSGHAKRQKVQIW